MNIIKYIFTSFDMMSRRSEHYTYSPVPYLSALEDKCNLAIDGKNVANGLFIAFAEAKEKIYGKETSK